MIKRKMGGALGNRPMERGIKTGDVGDVGIEVHRASKHLKRGRKMNRREGYSFLKSSHDLFTNSVKNALAQMRFYPAEIGGRKVRQLVQQPFNFTLTK